jgi:hypothetical protein
MPWVQIPVPLKEGRKGGREGGGGAGDGGRKEGRKAVLKITKLHPSWWSAILWFFCNWTTDLNPYFLLCPFPIPGSYTVLGCHRSSVSLDLWQSLVFLVSHDWHIEQEYCRMSFSVGWASVLRIPLGYECLGSKPLRWITFSWHHCRRLWRQHDLSLVTFTVITWLR